MATTDNTLSYLIDKQGNMELNRHTKIEGDLTVAGSVIGAEFDLAVVGKLVVGDIILIHDLSANAVVAKKAFVHDLIVAKRAQIETVSATGRVDVGVNGICNFIRHSINEIKPRSDQKQ
jgi:hypothetical protein